MPTPGGTPSQKCAPKEDSSEDEDEESSSEEEYDEKVVESVSMCEYKQQVLKGKEERFYEGMTPLERDIEELEKLQKEMRDRRMNALAAMDSLSLEPSLDSLSLLSHSPTRSGISIKPGGTSFFVSESIL